MSEEHKSKVADIIINRILKDVEQKGTMPWQRPYEIYNAFNWVTKESYRGINRLILPFGEYLTKNQINTYNREHNEDYRFQKGIIWYPVVFFKVDKKEVSEEEVQSKTESDVYADVEPTFICRADGWIYYTEDGRFFKKRNILRYTDVADRKWFKNSKGECLPSRIENGEVIITYSRPEEILERYIENSGVVLNFTTDIPCYIPSLDIVELNKHSKSLESYYSTAFHEIAHSTGHINRLNRPLAGKTDLNEYAKEECIAEITSCLLCSECGIHEFDTSETREYENNLAYITAWKKRIKDWGKEFIYIVSQSDKAFNYIMSLSDETWEEGI